MRRRLLHKRRPNYSSTHWRSAARWWILILSYTLTYRWRPSILCSHSDFSRFSWSRSPIEWLDLFFTWAGKSTILSHWWLLCCWSYFVWNWWWISFHWCCHLFFHFLRDSFFNFLLNFFLHFCHKFSFKFFNLSFDLCLHLICNCFLNQSLHLRWDVFKLICHFIICVFIL